MSDNEDLQRRFDDLIQLSQELLENPPTHISFRPSRKLAERMYGLYKQATVGDVQGKRPGMLHPIQRIKYDAWSRLQGMDRTDAMREYVETAEALRDEHL